MLVFHFAIAKEYNKHFFSGKPDHRIGEIIKKILLEGFLI